ncbi:MAG: linear amide C-N hydrolase [Selenomonadaceae bacterium]|nr:linear amide C-N hydrolase [Selenomonadaceae bacterium]
MKKIISLLLCLMVCSFAVCASAGSGAKKLPNGNVLLPELMDHVLDAGTFTELNYPVASGMAAKLFDNWGRCSAVVKTLPNGDTVVGRNMDFFITNKPAFVVRTKVPGCYETVGLSYMDTMIPDHSMAVMNGIPSQLYELIPFFSTDVLNSAGLYVEVNMRFGQKDENGNSYYGCSGTNPGAEQRVLAAQLTRYFGEHCANVKEVVEYAKNLDIYTMKSDDKGWNLTFILADAEGNYGLLEIAKNKVVFLEKQPIQTNFYVAEEFGKDQIYKCGLGRYDVLTRGRDEVKTEEDMYKLIDSVSYYQANFPERCRFDARTEIVDDVAGVTTAYVLAEENQPAVRAKMNATAEKLSNMTRQAIRNEGKYWNSTFTNVVNCNKRTLLVRFFEDENKKLLLTIDK